MTKRTSNDPPYEPVCWRCGAGHEGGSSNEASVPDRCLFGPCDAPVWRYGTGSVVANNRLIERRILTDTEVVDANGEPLTEGDTVRVIARGEHYGHTGRISRLVGPNDVPNVVFHVPWLAVNATSTRKIEGA